MEDLRKLKVAELKEQLVARGLDVRGVKEDLVQRLAAAMEADAAPAEAPAAAEAPTEVCAATIRLPNTAEGRWSWLWEHQLRFAARCRPRCRCPPEGTATARRAAPPFPPRRQAVEAYPCLLTARSLAAAHPFCRPPMQLLRHLQRMQRRPWPARPPPQPPPPLALRRTRPLLLRRQLL
jgi:hypothetical protein